MEAKVRAVSASQIETWDMCQRRWAWGAIAKIQLPPHPSAAKGSMIHKQLEHYLKGESPDCSTPALKEAWERAIPSVVNLPKPGTPGMLVEKSFSFDTSAGSIFRGFIDVLLPTSESVPGLGDGYPCVIDHKSTSAFKWAKTPEVLLTDTQANIYAYFAMAQFKVSRVNLLWNYITTKGSPDSMRVHLPIISSQVTDQFLGPISKSAVDINTAYQAQPNPMDLPPNKEACSKFPPHGCPFMNLCTDLNTGPLGHLTAEEESRMTQSGIDLFTMLEQQNHAENGVAPLTVGAGVAPLIVPGIDNAPPGFSVPSFLLQATPVQTQAVIPVQQYAAINPPESLLPPAPPIEEKKAKPKKPTKAEKAAAVTAVIEDNAGIMKQLAASERSAGVIDGLLAVASDLVNAGLLQIQEPPATIPAPAGFTLYLDCGPEGESITNASEIYAQVNAAIKKELGAADWRLVKYEGAGRFVAGFCALFDAGSWGDVRLDTRTPEGTLVLESLRARAARVVL